MGAEDLRRTALALARITGAVDVEDVPGEIFRAVLRWEVEPRIRMGRDY